MKLIEVLNALIPLRALTEARFTSFKKSRELAILRKKVEFEADFYGKEEKKIVETYAEKNEAGEPIILDGGRIKLKDIEAKIGFEKEITNLRELEISDIKKVKLSESDFADTSKIPTPYELIALESVIEFLEE
jgi:hypothetical protein